MKERLQWKPRVVSARDLAEEMAGAAALEVPPQLGTPGPPRLSLFSALRFSVWRELTTHWLFFLIMPLCIGIGALLPEVVRSSWSIFLMVTVVPILLMLSAASGSVSADSFWRGLHGPAWVQLLGRQLVHALMIGVPAILIGPSLLQINLLSLQPGALLPALLGVGTFYAALYTAVSAARTRLSGIHILAGPLIGVGIIGLSSLASVYLIRDWPLLLGLPIRMGLFALVAMVATYVWESQLGVWGAAVLRRGRWSPLVWCAALLAGLTGVELAGAAGPMPLGYQAALVAPDGSQILYKNDLRVLEGGRVWAWTPEQGHHRLALRFNESTFAGPDGALLYQQNGQVVLEQGSTVQSCGLDGGIQEVRWNPSGGGAVAWTAQGSSYLIEGSGQTCAAVQALGWQGTDLVYADGDAIVWGDQRVSLPTDGERTTLSWYRGQMFPHGTPSGAYQATVTDGVLSVTGPHLLDIQDNLFLPEPTDAYFWLNNRQVVHTALQQVMDLDRGLSWSYADHAAPSFLEPGMGFTPDGELLYFSDSGEQVRIPATGTR